MQKKRILFAVLNWGLGHATRSIPLINELSKEHHVVIVSTGKSLLLLKSEFPDLEAINVVDYEISYSFKSWTMPIVLLRQLPKLISRLRHEHKRTCQIVKDNHIDLIISDCRYGVWSKDVPSFLLTHQLNIKLPSLLSLFNPLTFWLNSMFFKNFNKIFVIDHQGKDSLAGDLSKRGKQNSKLHYIGLLANVEKDNANEDIDLFITISGPEPQRSFFEEIIMKQLPELSGKIVVLLGKPGEFANTKNDNIDIYTHLPRTKISELMNRAKVIVSRSGYSTVMELIALQKKAILIPTPGQSEQEYLADYFKTNKLFYTVKQENLNLKNDIINAKKFDNQALLMKVNDLEYFLKELFD